MNVHELSTSGWQQRDESIRIDTYLLVKKLTKRIEGDVSRKLDKDVEMKYIELDWLKSFVPNFNITPFEIDLLCFEINEERRADALEELLREKKRVQEECMLAQKNCTMGLRTPSEPIKYSTFNTTYEDTSQLFMLVREERDFAIKTFHKDNELTKVNLKKLILLTDA